MPFLSFSDSLFKDAYIINFQKSVDNFWYSAQIKMIYMFNSGFEVQFLLKGVLHILPLRAPKLACFVLYLKITNIFLKNSIYIL